MREKEEKGEEEALCHRDPAIGSHVSEKFFFLCEEGREVAV